MSPISDLNSVPGNTPIHPDDAAKLIPNLATKKELDEWERQNILEAQEWAFSSRIMKSRNPLDEIYLRELQSKNVWRDLEMGWQVSDQRRESRLPLP